MQEIKEEIERLKLLEKHKDYVESNSDLREFGWSKDLELRPYQIIGLNWILSRYYRHHGCILGDEMGLGKTCQTIACALYLRKVEAIERPDIVICPRSVLLNWRDEFQKFAPTLSIEVYEGDKAVRHAMQKRFKPKDKQTAYPFDVLLTTYEICLNDDSFFKYIPWNLMIVDEAHRLKNQKALLRSCLTQWSTTQRVLLTGTPVQNNLEELYSLLNFVADPIFMMERKEKFLWKFSDSENKQATSEMHQLLQPFLLRRIKEQVLKDLPKKSEVILFHGLSTVQKTLYKAILTKDTSIFKTSQLDIPGGTKKSLMNILMQLRKCASHPYLFAGIEPEPFKVGEHLVESSQKLVLIDRLLKHLKAKGHKVLLFSQMTRMLDIIQDYCTYRGYTYERLDGSVRGDERYLAVQNFQRNEDTFVFLLSTRAGGQGLNLTAADTVIFVDSDFNPQNDLQAAARAHRIGQNRPVKIVRLIGRNTVEEIILRRAEMKLKLTERVVEEGQFSIIPSNDNKLSLITDSKVTLQDIIRFGVDKLLQDSSADTKANDMDLGSLLGKSENGHWSEKAANGENDFFDLAFDEKNNQQAGPSNMYQFDGTDHKQKRVDEDAFNQLLLDEKARAEDRLDAERNRRQAGPSSLKALGDRPRTVPKPLTPEELEERLKMHRERIQENEKVKAEKKAENEKLKAEKKKTLWEENGYVSLNVTLDSSLEDEEAEEASNVSVKKEETSDGDSEDSSGGPAVDIKYIGGDVTQPVDSPNNQHCIIVHCADDSGNWGYGGVFSALTSRSPEPKEQYERAGEMEDIALGDCHMIPMKDMFKGSGKCYWLGLIIAQHRDRKSNLSGIKLASLATGLDKVYQVAKQKKASVHLPRIGHDTPGFNWYGTERMLRQKLTAKGIPTFVYYYRRNRAQKRKRSTDSDSSQKPSTSKLAYNPSSCQMSSFDDDSSADDSDKSFICDSGDESIIDISDWTSESACNYSNSEDSPISVSDSDDDDDVICLSTAKRSHSKDPSISGSDSDDDIVCLSKAKLSHTEDPSISGSDSDHAPLSCLSKVKQSHSENKAQHSEAKSSHSKNQSSHSEAESSHSEAESSHSEAELSRLENQSCHSLLFKKKNLVDKKKNSDKLINIFRGKSIHCQNFSEEDARRFKRYIIAYDGDFDSEIHDTTTHIIVRSTDVDLQALHSLMQNACCTGIILTLDWLKKSIRKGQCYQTAPFKMCAWSAAAAAEPEKKLLLSQIR